MKAKKEGTHPHNIFSIMMLINDNAEIQIMKDRP